jgi:hypothetical protein
MSNATSSGTSKIKMSATRFWSQLARMCAPLISLQSHPENRRFTKHSPSLLATGAKRFGPPPHLWRFRRARLKAAPPVGHQ